MLKSQKGHEIPTTTYGFLVGVEIEDGATTPEQVAVRLADSLAYMEGVGVVDCEALGKIELYDPSMEVPES